MKTVVKNKLANCNEDAYLPSLHLSIIELRCKLQEKLHRVTWRLVQREIDVLMVLFEAIYYMQCSVVEVFDEFRQINLEIPPSKI